MDLIVWRFNRKMYAYVEHLLKSRFNAVFATTGESQIARSFFFVARVRKWTANANRTRNKTKNLLWLRSWSSCADEMGKKMRSDYSKCQTSGEILSNAIPNCSNFMVW